MKPFALVALSLALLALIAGDPKPRSANIDLDALARAVEREEDHVDALELAEWIRARKSGLRVIDVRTKAEFEQYRVPTAQHIALGEITSAEFSPADVIVLYSEGGTHAAQAWFLLRARGFTNVFFLRGGVMEWLETVMSPAAPLSQRQRELSEYFGGQPSMTIAPADGSTEETVKKLRRRGC